MIPTPYERQLFARLSAAFFAGGRLAELRVFGSRARDEADERSDLDIALLFDGARDRAIEAQVNTLQSEEASAAPVQLVPIWSEEPPSLLRAVVLDEGLTVWKRNG